MDEEKQKLIKSNAKDPVLIAAEMVKAYPNIVRCQENIYIFDGKIYNLMSDRDLDALFMDFCLKSGATNSWKNINSIIRAFLVYPQVKSVPAMNDYPDLICLNNGVLNIKTNDFVPHPTPYYFDSIVNVDYDVNAKNCPTFIKYLTDTFSGDKETMGNIIRLGGYLLDTSCKAERMFLLDGNGANGKSVLINIFKMFFSPDQVSPLSLDVLASNGFSKELLIKSRVNFAAEQKKSYLDSEELKKIITGDLIEINRKFKISLTFAPKTKIIVACNGVPKFNDNSYAIERRIIIIKFHNQYVSEFEYKKIANPERMNIFVKDNGIFEKITKEKSSILNMFIEGLIDLRKANYEFIETADSTVAMNEFKRDNDTIREFLEDNYRVNYDKKKTLSEIYDHLRTWHKRFVSDSSIFKFRINELGKRIKDIFKIESLGREYIFNSYTEKVEKETMYPLELIEASVEDLPVMSAEEAKTQTGLDFNK